MKKERRQCLGIGGLRGADFPIREVLSLRVREMVEHKRK